MTKSFLSSRREPSACRTAIYVHHIVETVIFPFLHELRVKMSDHGTRSKIKVKDLVKLAFVEKSGFLNMYFGTYLHLSVRLYMNIEPHGILKCQHGQ